MILNHEVPDPVVPPRDTEDWSSCSVCHQADPNPPRCSVCDCLVCNDCWDEHRAECSDEPQGPDHPLDADEDHARGDR